MRLDEPTQGGRGLGHLPERHALDVLARAPFALVLTDPRLDENPIVYVNAAFEATTGYGRDFALGRNCRFLQGRDTDPRTVERLRSAIGEGREITVDIQNYRADGSPFWNRLMIAPLRDDAGRVEYFAGVQKVLGSAADVAGDAPIDAAMREIQHRVKNHLAMVVSMIRLEGRRSQEGEAFATLARRVESLSLLYDELSYRGGENRDAVALGPYLGRVAGSIAELDRRAGVRIGLDFDPLTVPMDTAVSLGLLLSELLTNALRHAFAGREGGSVQTRVEELPDGGIRLTVADDGVGLPPGSGWPDGSGGLGGRIVAQLVRALNATLAVTGGDTGTILVLDVPRAARGPF